MTKLSFYFSLNFSRKNDAGTLCGVEIRLIDKFLKRSILSQISPT